MEEKTENSGTLVRGRLRAMELLGCKEHQDFDRQINESSTGCQGGSSRDISCGSVPRNSSGLVWHSFRQNCQPTDNPGKFQLGRDKNQWMFSQKKPSFQCSSQAALISPNAPKKVQPYQRHSKDWLPADPGISLLLAGFGNFFPSSGILSQLLIRFSSVIWSLGNGLDTSSS